MTRSGGGQRENTASASSCVAANVYVARPGVPNGTIGSSTGSAGPAARHGLLRELHDRPALVEHTQASGAWQRRPPRARRRRALDEARGLPPDAPKLSQQRAPHALDVQGLVARQRRGERGLRSEGLATELVIRDEAYGRRAAQGEHARHDSGGSGTRHE